MEKFPRPYYQPNLPNLTRPTELSRQIKEAFHIKFEPVVNYKELEEALVKGFKSK